MNDGGIPKDLSPIIPQSQELNLPFPLIQELFKYGEKTFGGQYNGSATDFYDEHLSVAQSKSVPLPEQFHQLVPPGLDASQFYLVYFSPNNNYDNSDAPTRVAIANVPQKYESDKPSIELIFSQETGGMHLIVNQAIRNNTMTTTPAHGNKSTIEPFASSTKKYRLLESSNPVLVRTNISRSDEVKISDQPARWARFLTRESEPSQASYRESYIFNRPDNFNHTRLGITFKISGALLNPQSVTIQIGDGPLLNEYKTASDPSGKFHLFIQPGEKNNPHFLTLKLDPNFAFLEDQVLNPEKIIAFLQERIRSLELLWNQPQSVFDPEPTASLADSNQ